MQYSSIFNQYYKDKTKFLNILRKIELPHDKSIPLYKSYTVPYDMPWHFLSYILYNSIDYYWLLLLANDGIKKNPLKATAGDKIFIIDPIYINELITSIQNDI